MKKLTILFLILLVISATGFSQGCLPEGITFTSQQQIDNFQTDYPNCTMIEGDVIILNADISNLDGLSVLTEIGGKLIIDSTQLTSLQGLNALTSIGDGFSIVYNMGISNMAGLDALTTIEGSLSVGFSEMENFYGMPELNSIGGLMLYMTGTTSLSGLEGLSAINGTLSLDNCFDLTSLSGLENVISIDGTINIFITGLTSLTGLDNIESATINSLYIVSNENLSTCEVKSVCDYLSNPNGTITIQNNAPGCNNQPEVYDACWVKVDETAAIDTHIQIFPNPAKNTITILNSSNTKINEVVIYSPSGKIILQKKSPANSIDISKLPPGLYFVEIKTGLGDVRRKLIVE